MKEAAEKEEDAVAIAAPQIGISMRIFLVLGKTFAKTIKDDDGITHHEELLPDDLVFINPEIIKESKKKEETEEGCLSVRWLYGKVKRSSKITIRAYDENGNRITRGASGLLSQIFQHEINHLNGILFIDKAENIREIKPETHVKH